MTRAGDPAFSGRFAEGARSFTVFAIGRDFGPGRMVNP